MKKFVFLIVAVLAIFFVSCSPRVEQPLKISMHKDTIVSYKEAITAPLFSCDGKKSCYEKVIGWKDVSIPISLSKDTTVYGDFYRVEPVSETTDYDRYFGWLFRLPIEVLWILLFPLLLLVIWGLVAFFSWLFRRRRPVAPAPAAPAPASPAPVVPPAPPVVPVAGSGPTYYYYFGRVENLHIHNNEPPVIPPAPRARAKK
ncbi:MAG: hypothetical protein ABH951_01905 [Patescibacteria group bacterium]